MRGFQISDCRLQIAATRLRCLIFSFCFLPSAFCILRAQVPDSAQPAAPAQSAPAAPAAPAASQPASSPQKDRPFLGKDVPDFNPGSEIVTWDGEDWNINNNRLFEARFA